jgi:hypothetical protein
MKYHVIKTDKGEFLGMDEHGPCMTYKESHTLIFPTLDRAKQCLGFVHYLFNCSAYIAERISVTSYTYERVEQ